MSGNWSAGKKSATSLDHFQYYAILHHEHKMVRGIEKKRALVLGRHSLMVEGIA